MKNQLSFTHLIVAASIALTAAGCSEKTTTTTQVNPDGSQTTTVIEKKGFDTRETVTTTPPPDQTDPDASEKLNINFSTGKDTADGAAKVHLRGPGIKVDANDNDKSVNIKLPFVKVKKDGDGHVQVNTPFVNIESNEH